MARPKTFVVQLLDDERGTSWTDIINSTKDAKLKSTLACERWIRENGLDTGVYRVVSFIRLVRPVKSTTTSLFEVNDA